MSEHFAISFCLSSFSHLSSLTACREFIFVPVSILFCLSVDHDRLDSIYLGKAHCIQTFGVLVVLGVEMRNLCTVCLAGSTG